MGSRQSCGFTAALHVAVSHTIHRNLVYHYHGGTKEWILDDLGENHGMASTRHSEAYHKSNRYFESRAQQGTH